MNGAHPYLLLYDGVCGLCNRSVSFVLRHDAHARFRFAPLQGPTAARLAAAHGFDPTELDTVYLVVDHGGPNERLLARSRAIFAVWRELGGAWRIPALLRFLPRSLTDLAYALVARTRYALFGKTDRCVLPPPEWRSRSLDEPEETRTSSASLTSP